MANLSGSVSAVATGNFAFVQIPIGSTTMEHPLKNWFTIALHAVRQEDLFVRSCLWPYRLAGYAKWYPGIGELYETTIACMILRGLWVANYPRALGWELDYPGGKLDLAVFNEPPEVQVLEQQIEHGIEVKQKAVSCYFKEQQSVWFDILKLLWLEKADHRYVLLFTYAPPDKVEYLADDVRCLLEMRLGGKQQQYTFESLLETIHEAKYRRYIPAYLARFGGVEEVLSQPFDTGYKGCETLGRVRMSLIYVKYHNSQIAFE